MLDELIQLGSKLPAEVVAGLISLGRFLLNTGDEAAQREAMVAAVRAAESEVLRRSFPKE